MSLREKLHSISKVELPEFPETEDWLPSEYFNTVGASVSGEARWEVDRNGLGLGFFTFSKFLMWRDLAASAWPVGARLLAHPLVSALLGHGQGFDPAPPIADDDEPIDKKIDTAAAIHVLDADSSQALAIEKRGRDETLSSRDRQERENRKRSLTSSPPRSMPENQSSLWQRRPLRLKSSMGA